MPEEKKAAPKKMNVAIDADLLPWVSYAASVRNKSVTGYINDAIRRDMEGGDALGADGAVRDAYDAFTLARDKHGDAED